jgi:hypothetical protein
MAERTVGMLHTVASRIYKPDCKLLREAHTKALINREPNEHLASHRAEWEVNKAAQRFSIIRRGDAVWPRQIPLPAMPLAR